MKVQQLRIEAFRGIDGLSLSLDPSLTVIVGDNGVGKTSVLDSLAILLDNYLARWLRGSAQSAERLKDADIKIGCHTSSVAIKVSHSNGMQGDWTLRRQTRHGRIKNPSASEFSGLNSLVRAVLAADEGRLTGAPLLIYYGQRRAVLDLPRRIRSVSNQNPDAAFADALKVGDLNFREFVSWFRDKSLQEAQHWRRDRHYVDIQLDSVRRAMTQATGLEDPSYRVPTPSGLCFTKLGVELRVDQLSSGERSFLSLAGDLARRLAMLNPDAPDPLKGEGVVAHGAPGQWRAPHAETSGDERVRGRRKLRVHLQQQAPRWRCPTEVVVRNHRRADSYREGDRGRISVRVSGGNPATGL